MGPTDTTKRAEKLRGFTLIELLIVIAIIAILAGMISLAMSGFRRDASIETANNKAHIAYTGLQNVLLQCEISQDIDLFNVRKINTPTSTDKPTYCVVAFELSNGAIANGQYTLTTMYGAAAVSADKNKAIRGSGTGVSDDEKKAYKKFETYVKSNFSQDFTGAMAFYIDLEDYLVDSAVWCETASGLTTSINSVSAGVPTQRYMVSMAYSTADKTNGKLFVTFDNVAAQKTMNKKNGIVCGAYPLVSEAKGSAGSSS